MLWNSHKQNESVQEYEESYYVFWCQLKDCQSGSELLRKDAQYLNKSNIQQEHANTKDIKRAQVWDLNRLLFFLQLLQVGIQRMIVDHVHNVASNEQECSNVEPISS